MTAGGGVVVRWGDEEVPVRIRPAIDHDTGEMYLPVTQRGRAVLEEPLLNKGTAFTPEERAMLGLRGMLPAHTSSMGEQLSRVREQYDEKGSDLERHIYLAALHDRNETLFFRFLLENLEELVPIVYTPTVAEACRHWSRIFRQARGIYVTPADRGRVAEALRSRGFTDAAVVVATDNERILGIGDQGAGGMGIPVGKLALYTVAAGIHPSLTVPISLDVGTENTALLADPLYLGVRERRLRGDAYWSLVDELVAAVREVFPRAVFQWEDFANRTSFRALDAHRKELASFNDDIQGTAAMVLGGMLAAMRVTGGELAGQTVVIAGAGSAGTGITRLLRAAGVERIFVADSRGLLVTGRAGIDEHKAELAVPAEAVAGWQRTGPGWDLLDVVRGARPTALIGVSGTAALFTEPLVRAMAAHAPTPIVMPLSNPTSCCEATPSEVLAWTGGRALVATGSPFAEVELDGVCHRIGQANNVFVFPGVGLGSYVARAATVTDGMFLAAARCLADSVPADVLRAGALFPPIGLVRPVSRRIAHAVAEQAVAEGAAEPIVDVESRIAQAMWEPVYLPYRPA